MKNSIFATEFAASLVKVALEARVGAVKVGASNVVSSAPALGQTFNIEQ